MLAIADSDSENRQTNLGEICSLLLGLWLCERVLQQAVPGVDLLAPQVEARLHTEVKANAFNPYQYDTKLLLLCHKILHTRKYRADGIEEFARGIAQALNELPSIPLRYAGEALLLTSLGYELPPPDYSLSAEEIGEYTVDLLRANKNQVRSVCNILSAATRFGQQPPRVPEEIKSCLRQTLSIILLQSLREYDLELGSTLR